MDQDTDLPFDLPSVSRKKITAAFDGGRISSDGGVVLLSAAERRIGTIDRLWRLIPDRRNPFLVTHSLASILKARVFAIACGYEEATIWLSCVPIRLSSWHVGDCLKAARTCAHNRPCRALRMRRICAACLS